MSSFELSSALSTVEEEFSLPSHIDLLLARRALKIPPRLPPEPIRNIVNLY